jgi:hypothetical protein
MKLSLLLLISSFISCWGSDVKISDFWDWFKSESHLYQDLQNADPNLFGRFSEEIKSINEDLVYEFSSNKIDEKYELYISAGGLEDLFPVVERVVEEAPDIPGWRIVKFKKRTDLGGIKFEGRDFDVKDIKYHVLKSDEPGKIGIALFCDGYTEDEHDFFVNVGFVFLDAAIGEYDVTMKLSDIYFLGSESEHAEGSKPFGDFRFEFDSIMKDLSEGNP